MAIQVSFGTIRTGVKEAAEPAEATSTTPFRIAVLGDFTGRASRGVCETGAALAKRKPIIVDRDNLEEVLARLGVEVHLPAPDGKRMAVQFKELDDFLPDRLVPQLAIFDKLRELRRKLSSSSTFEEAAREVRGWSGARPTPTPAPAPDKPPLPTTGEGVLAMILGEPAPTTPSGPTQIGNVDWNAFMREVVAPFAIPKANPQQGELVAQVDTATSGLLRTLLHQPDFQALEAAWRGLYFLVRRLETDSSLKIGLIDVSRAEMSADLASADDLGTSGLYKLLVESTVGTPGAAPWAVLTGLYTFGPTQADAELLGRLAQVAKHAGAPFLTAASSLTLGCKSFDDTPDPDDWTHQLDATGRDAWAALRKLPEATSLGLLLPRFLLRLPHGKETNPVESFDFEEVPEGQPHEGYLWGNPALALAYLLGDAFTRAGWDVTNGLAAELKDLPVHVYKRDRETQMKPCAEAVLSDRAADRIQDHGIMPLLSVQDQDSVQLRGFFSLAGPGKPLAGRW